METQEKERIKSHLHELITYTICNAELLTFCHQRGVLGVADIDKITSIPEHIEKAHAFYQIIQTRTNSYKVLNEALQKTGQGDVAAIMETGVVPSSLDNSSRVKKILYDDASDRKRIRLDSGGPSATTRPIFDVTAPVSLFTGRRRELEELHEKVQRAGGSGHGHPIVISQMTSISGLGGIGKTQLSRQYVQERSQYFDNNCIWLNAETKNSLTESFRTLAKDQLGITTKDANGTEKKIENLARDVYTFFQDRKCLFVFDNAEREPWLKQFLPVASQLSGPGQSRPFILITSRTRDWDKGIAVVELNELDMDEAVAFVKKGLELEQDASQDAIVTQLVKRLQCFPLAIQQAISYIECQQQIRETYTIDDYLEEFERRQKELLSFDEMNSELFNDYNRTTLTTWKMTVEKIGKDDKYGEVAVKILYAMAYLSPEKIKREMFLGLSGISSEEELFGGVRLLVTYSMVRGEEKQSLLSIHRLVQEVTRLELIASNMEASTMESVLQMLIPPEENLEATLEYVNHVLGIWPFLWNFPNIIKQNSDVPDRVIRSLSWEMRDAEAEIYASENMRKLATVLGDDHEDIHRTLDRFSGVLYRQGKYEEAIDTASAVLEWRKIYHGEFDSRTVSTMNNLGLIYLEEDRYEEAFPYFQTVCDVAKIHLPEDRRIVSTYLPNLSLTLLKLGKAKEAFEILKDVEMRILAGESTRQLTNIRAIKVDCLNELGDFDAALNVFKADSEKMVELTGRDRINVPTTVGNVLRNMGKYEAALDKHKQAYQECVDLLGAGHSKTISCMQDIAMDLGRMGKHEKSILLLDDCTKKMEEFFGGSNYHVLWLKVLLADGITKDGKDVPRASALLREQKQIIVENGWEKLAYFKSKVWNEIARIENDIDLKSINQVNT